MEYLKTFNGRVESVGTHTVKKGSTDYQNVMLNIEGESFSVPMVSGMGSAGDYFSKGVPGKYFYIKLSDIKDSFYEIAPLNMKLSAESMPDMAVYAVITDDGEHVYDRELFSRTSKELDLTNNNMERISKLFSLMKFIALIPLLFIMYAAPWLVSFILITIVFLGGKIFQKIFPFKKMKEIAKSSLKRADIGDLENFLSQNGFDLQSSKVSTRFAWEN